MSDSGGWGLCAHLTLNGGIPQRLMLFGQMSLPSSSWRDTGDHERFRVGAGLIIVLGA